MTSRGFTLLEILIVLAISLSLVSVFSSIYLSFNKHVAFDAGAQVTVNFLKEARSLTLASRNADVYGVHFEATRIVLFTGSTFSEPDPNNREYKFKSDIQLTTINLTGGGSDVVFDRLTGETAQFGTTTLSRISNPGTTKDIVIKETGIVELQ